MSLFKKRGGGFLNGESGVIDSYKFDTKTFGEGSDAYTKLSVELNILQDGAAEPVQQFLDAGFLYEEGGISDDGLTLTGGAQVQEGSEFAAFVQSIIDNGGPQEADFPEDGSNFEAILSWRYTFGRAKNVERQMAAGRKKLGCKKAGNVGKGGKTFTDEEISLAGRRQDKTDKTKFYDHDYLTVSKALGVTETAAPAKKAAPKTASKAKASKAAPVSDDFESADNLLVELLADAKDKTIKKSGLGSLVVRKALETDMSDEDRDAIRKLFGDENYLGRNNGWTFKSAGKDSAVSL